MDDVEFVAKVRVERQLVQMLDPRPDRLSELGGGGGDGCVGPDGLGAGFGGLLGERVAALLGVLGLPDGLGEGLVVGAQFTDAVTQACNRGLDDRFGAVEVAGTHKCAGLPLVVVQRGWTGRGAGASSPVPATWRARSSTPCPAACGP